MLYAKESLKILLWVVETQENAQRVPRVTFISHFKRLYKNPGKLWEAARSRRQWEDIIIHWGPGKSWYTERESVAYLGDVVVALMLGVVELPLHFLQWDFLFAQLQEHQLCDKPSKRQKHFVKKLPSPFSNISFEVLVHKHRPIPVLFCKTYIPYRNMAEVKYPKLKTGKLVDIAKSGCVATHNNDPACSFYFQEKGYNKPFHFKNDCASLCLITLLYLITDRDRIVGKSHCQYRLYTCESSSEWSNSVQAQFPLGSACNLSN